MDMKVQKTFEAMFLLEDIRQIFRDTAPMHELTAEQQKQMQELLETLSKTIADLDAGKGDRNIKHIIDNIELRTREEEAISIDPIQRAGVLTPEARKALIAYGDGYSTCDYCFSPFRLDHIKKPPINEFYDELAEFLNMDVARVVRGARRGFQIVANAILDKGDVALISSLGHYSLGLGIESSGATWREVSLDENDIITGENTAAKIEQVKKDTGSLPKLIAISHFDYMLGNEHDIPGISKVSREYGIPFLYNGAYTVGVMPVDGKALGADFVVGSGHKSMAAPAPTGVLAVTEEYADQVFATTNIEGDITGRKFGIKETHLLGCTVMGAPLIAMMASFPHVKERVKNWDDEVRKSNYFIGEFLKIEGNSVLSEMPRKHTLSKVETLGYDKIAGEHKRRGYFLHDELKKMGVTGMFPGATKQWKLNTYGLSQEQIEYLVGAFKDVAEKYGLSVED